MSDETQAKLADWLKKSFSTREACIHWSLSMNKWDVELWDSDNGGFVGCGTNDSLDAAVLAALECCDDG